MADNIAKEGGSTMMWWIAFLVTTVITLVMLKYMSEWFWLGLPFSLTALTKAMRVI